VITVFNVLNYSELALVIVLKGMNKATWQGDRYSKKIFLTAVRAQGRIQSRARGHGPGAQF